MCLYAGAYVSSFHMSANIMDWTPGLQSVGSHQRATVCLLWEVLTGNSPLTELLDGGFTVTVGLHATLEFNGGCTGTRAFTEARTSILEQSLEQF